MMSLNDALLLAFVCLCGAMVPGASLIVVLNSAVSSGTRHGLIASWSHALAVGLYALLTTMGLAALLITVPAVVVGVQILGAIFLVYMAVDLLRAPTVDFESAGSKAGYQSAARGFLVAFLNPKLAIFFLAVFSQFVDVEAGLAKQFLMALIALVVDGVWYSLVVLGVSRFPAFLQSHNQFFNRLFALVLLALAVRLLWVF
jgi:threonine/homoserine/homoserine lactone efflux protein